MNPGDHRDNHIATSGNTPVPLLISKNASLNTV